jgi:hypothetical protein
MATERKMTAKGFLTRTNSNKAATSTVAFLKAHQEYLLTGEVAYATAPIVEGFIAGTIPATPALMQIKQVVFDHIRLVEDQKAQESLERESTTTSDKPFQCIIRDAATGEVCTREKDDGTVEKLQKYFDKPQDAERWADRRLFDGAPSWYANVYHFGKDWDVIERDDSIARILKRPRGAVTKTNSYGSSTLGFGVKVREKAVKFSHG